MADGGGGSQTVNEIAVALTLDISQFMAGVDAAKTGVQSIAAIGNGPAKGIRAGRVQTGYTEEGTRQARAGIAVSMRDVNRADYRAWRTSFATHATREPVNVPVTVNVASVRAMRQQIQRELGTIPVNVALSMGKNTGVGLFSSIIQSTNSNISRQQATAFARRILEYEHPPEKRATGGPVRPGVPYTVGENGRETFVPDRPGRIIPHGNVVPTTRIRAEHRDRGGWGSVPFMEPDEVERLRWRVGRGSGPRDLVSTYLAGTGKRKTPFFYHVTPVENIRSIIERGVLPLRGESTASVKNAAASYWDSHPGIGWGRRPAEDPNRRVTLAARLRDIPSPEPDPYINAMTRKVVPPEVLYFIGADKRLHPLKPRRRGGSVRGYGGQYGAAKPAPTGEFLRYQSRIWGDPIGEPGYLYHATPRMEPIRGAWNWGHRPGVIPTPQWLGMASFWSSVPESIYGEGLLRTPQTPDFLSRGPESRHYTTTDTVPRQRLQYWGDDNRWHRFRRGRARQEGGRIVIPRKPYEAYGYTLDPKVLRPHIEAYRNISDVAAANPLSRAGGNFWYPGRRRAILEEASSRGWLDRSSLGSLLRTSREAIYATGLASPGLPDKAAVAWTHGILDYASQQRALGPLASVSQMLGDSPQAKALRLQVLQGMQKAGGMTPGRGYDNLSKALRAALGETPIPWGTSPKVRPYTSNIFGNENALTVDSHHLHAGAFYGDEAEKAASVLSRKSGEHPTLERAYLLEASRIVQAGYTDIWRSNRRWQAGIWGEDFPLGSKPQPYANAYGNLIVPKGMRKMASDAGWPMSPSGLLLPHLVLPRRMAGGPMFRPVDPDIFHAAITSAAQREQPSGRRVGETVHVYSPDEYAAMRTYLSKDMLTGYALKGEDLVSVFNVGGQGRGKSAVRSAIQRGAMTLDAFGEHGTYLAAPPGISERGYRRFAERRDLPSFYSRFGFREYSREPWNPQYAPEGWQGGTPDVVYMRRRPRHRLDGGRGLKLRAFGEPGLPSLSSMMGIPPRGVIPAHLRGPQLEEYKTQTRSRVGYLRDLFDLPVDLEYGYAPVGEESGTYGTTYGHKLFRDLGVAGPSVIRLNAALSTDEEKARFAELIRKGQFVPHASAAASTYTATHEFGHALENAYPSFVDDVRGFVLSPIGNMDPDARKHAIGQLNELSKRVTWPTVASGAWASSRLSSEAREIVDLVPSKYAATRPKEWWSEQVAAVMHQPMDLWGSGTARVAEALGVMQEAKSAGPDVSKAYDLLTQVFAKKRADGGDVEGIRSFLGSLKSLSKKFGHAPKTIGTYSALGEKFGYAATPDTERIDINLANMTTLREKFPSLTATGFYIPGLEAGTDPFQYIAGHEYGHLLENLNEEEVQRFREQFFRGALGVKDPWHNKQPSIMEAIGAHITSTLGGAYPHGQTRLDALEPQLQRYARAFPSGRSYKSPQEWLAETFAATQFQRPILRGNAAKALEAILPGLKHRDGGGEVGRLNRLFGHDTKTLWKQPNPMDAIVGSIRHRAGDFYGRVRDEDATRLLGLGRLLLESGAVGRPGMADEIAGSLLAENSIDTPEFSYLLGKNFVHRLLLQSAYSEEAQSRGTYGGSNYNKSLGELLWEKPEAWMRNLPRLMQEPGLALKFRGKQALKYDKFRDVTDEFGRSIRALRSGRSQSEPYPGGFVIPNEPTGESNQPYTWKIRAKMAREALAPVRILEGGGDLIESLNASAIEMGLNEFSWATHGAGSESRAALREWSHASRNQMGGRLRAEGGYVPVGMLHHMRLSEMRDDPWALMALTGEPSFDRKKKDKDKQRRALGGTALARRLFGKYIVKPSFRHGPERAWSEYDIHPSGSMMQAVHGFMGGKQKLWEESQWNPSKWQVPSQYDPQPREGLEGVERPVMRADDFYEKYKGATIVTEQAMQGALDEVSCALNSVDEIIQSQLKPVRGRRPGKYADPADEPYSGLTHSGLELMERLLGSEGPYLNVKGGLIQTRRGTYGGELGIASIEPRRKYWQWSRNQLGGPIHRDRGGPARLARDFAGLPLGWNEVGAFDRSRGYGSWMFGSRDPQEALARAWWHAYWNVPGVIDARLDNEYAEENRLLNPDGSFRQYGLMNEALIRQGLRPRRRPRPSKWHASGGPESGAGLYIVGEVGDELFVPNRSAHLIPPHVMKQIPKRAEGGPTGIFKVGKRGQEFFTPPEDGWIVPHRLVDEVPHAAGGVRGNVPDRVPPWMEDIRQQIAEQIQTQMMAMDAQTPVANLMRQETQGSLMALTARNPKGMAAVGGAVMAGRIQKAKQRAKEAQQATAEFARWERRYEGEYRPAAVTRDVLAAAMAGRVDETGAITPQAQAERARLASERQAAAAARRPYQLSAAYRKAKRKEPGLEFEDWMTRPGAPKRRAVEERYQAATTALKDFDDEMASLPKLFKEAEARLASLAGLQKKYTDTMAAAAEANAKLSPGFGATMANFGGILLTTSAYGLAMQGIGEVMGAVTEASKPAVDALVGWHGMATRVTNDMASLNVQMKGNQKAVLGVTAATAGMSQAGMDLMDKFLMPSIAAKSGGQTLKAQQDLYRSMVAMSKGGVPEGFAGGYGGLFGSPILASQMGGGMGSMEILAGTMGSTTTGGGTDWGQTLLNAALGVGAGAIAGGLTGAGVGAVFGGAPAVPGAIVGGVVGGGGAAVNMLMNGTPQAAGGVPINQEIVDNLIKVLNDAIVRGAPQMGANAVSGVRFEYAAPEERPAIIKQLESLQLPDSVLNYAKNMANSGYFLADGSGFINNAKKYVNSFQQLFTGLPTPTPESVFTQSSWQLRAQRASIGEQARVQRETVMPFQTWMGALQQGYGAGPGGGFLSVAERMGGPAAFSGSNLSIGPFTGAPNMPYTQRLASQGLGKMRAMVAEQAGGVAIGPQVPGSAASSRLRDFDSLASAAKDAGVAIGGLTKAMAQLSAGVAAAQFANEIRLLKRSLSDIRGFLGKPGGSQYGQRERQQFELSQRSQQLSINMERRSIATQLALASFAAPGETGEERYARAQEAIVEARIKTEQVNIGQEQLGLTRAQTMEGATRQETDTSIQLGLTEMQRDATVKLAAMSQQLADTQQDLAAIGGLMQSMADEALSNFNAGLSVAAGAMAELGPAVKDLPSAMSALQGATVALFQTIDEGLKGGLVDEGTGRYNLTFNPSTGSYVLPKDTIPVDTNSGPGYAPGTKPNASKPKSQKASAAGYLGYHSTPTTMTVGEAAGEQVAVLRNPSQVMLPPQGQQSNPVNVSVNINGTTVRSENDIQALAQRVAYEVERILGRKSQLVGVRGPSF